MKYEWLVWHLVVFRPNTLEVEFLYWVYSKFNVIIYLGDTAFQSCFYRLVKWNTLAFQNDFFKEKITMNKYLSIQQTCFYAQLTVFLFSLFPTFSLLSEVLIAQQQSNYIFVCWDRFFFLYSMASKKNCKTIIPIRVYWIHLNEQPQTINDQNELN